MHLPLLILARIPSCSLLPPSDQRRLFSFQVVLINAVKDVAKALGDLISATKAAAGKVGDDPAVWQLKNSAKVGGNGSNDMRGQG